MSKHYIMHDITLVLKYQTTTAPEKQQKPLKMARATQEDVTVKFTNTLTEVRECLRNNMR